MLSSNRFKRESKWIRRCVTSWTGYKTPVPYIFVNLIIISRNRENKQVKYAVTKNSRCVNSRLIKSDRFVFVFFSFLNYWSHKNPLTHNLNIKITIRLSEITHKTQWKKHSYSQQITHRKFNWPPKMSKEINFWFLQTGNQKEKKKHTIGNIIKDFFSIFSIRK